MSLRNKLPPEYESSLSSVVNGKMDSRHIFDPMFRELNPSRATSIADEMRKALWSVEPQALESRWLKPTSGLQRTFKAIENRPEISALFSVSWNGYVREKAVRTWPRVNNSFELALLLIRLNDWVEQVRLSAIFKLEKLIAMPVDESGLTQKTVLGCMDLILNPRRFGRSKEIEFRVLNQLLNMNEMPYALANYITHNANDYAPRYLKHGLKRGVLIDALPNMSANGKHPEVRRIATHALLNGQYVWKEKGGIRHRVIDLEVDRTELSGSALRDKTPTVRCVALSYISEYKPNGLYSEETFRDHVGEKRFSVVEQAIYGLKTLGIDYVDEIRQKILQGETSNRSLAIIGRYGTTEDGVLIFSQVNKMPENSRISTLGTAAKLGNRQAQDALEKIAFDRNHDEARNAIHRLSKTNYSPDIHLVLESIRSGQDVITRGYISLIRKLPTMQLALAISELDATSVNVDSLNLWQLLIRKRNTGAFLPSEMEISDLRKKAEGSPQLMEKLYKTLGIRL